MRSVCCLLVFPAVWLSSTYLSVHYSSIPVYWFIIFICVHIYQAYLSVSASLSLSVWLSLSISVCPSMYIFFPSLYHFSRWEYIAAFTCLPNSVQVLKQGCLPHPSHTKLNTLAFIYILYTLIDLYIFFYVCVRASIATCTISITVFKELQLTPFSFLSVSLFYLLAKGWWRYCFKSQWTHSRDKPKTRE